MLKSYDGPRCTLCGRGVAGPPTVLDPGPREYTPRLCKQGHPMQQSASGRAYCHVCLSLGANLQGPPLHHHGLGGDAAGMVNR